MSEQKYVSEEPSKTMNITENINRESAKIENITGNKEDTNQLVKDAQERKFSFNGKIS